MGSQITGSFIYYLIWASVAYFVYWRERETLKCTGDMQQMLEAFFYFDLGMLTLLTIAYLFSFCNFTLAENFKFFVNVIFQFVLVYLCYLSIERYFSLDSELVCFNSATQENYDATNLIKTLIVIFLVLTSIFGLSFILAGTYFAISLCKGKKK